jgi:hypothetical protein
MNVCGSLWIPSLAGLKGSFGGDDGDLSGVSLGLHGSGGAKEQGQRIRDPMVCGAVAPWAYGEGLNVNRCGDVSALPGALPQLSMSPTSWQSPWIMEVRSSVTLSW